MILLQCNTTSDPFCLSTLVVGVGSGGGGGGEGGGSGLCTVEEDKGPQVDEKETGSPQIEALAFSEVLVVESVPLNR